MGRKKKKNNRLRNLGLCALITTLGVYVYFSFMNVDIKMPDLNLGFPSKIKNESRIQQSLSVEDIIPKIEDKKGELPQVKIFFIGHQGGKEVYRPVYRENNSNRSNVEYAVRLSVFNKSATTVLSTSWEFILNVEVETPLAYSVPISKYIVSQLLNT